MRPAPPRARRSAIIAGVHPLAAAVALSAAGSVGGLVVASSILFIGEATRRRLVGWLVSYAVGTLLGAALLKLLPEALESVAAPRVLAALLSGIVTFFVLEKIVVWRHCHQTGECAIHASAAPLVIVGDAVHTFVDGAIIAAAVLTSIPLGVTTAVAVVAHEIPQEIGDFAVLLHAGYSRRRALLLNLTSGAGGIIGAVGVYYAAGPLPAVLPYALGFAAGSFLYVAMSDLIPGLHRGQPDANPVRQVALLALGIATIVAL
jgi:zinc and cadmium transporter